jgi:hypothetical protein
MVVVVRLSPRTAAVFQEASTSGDVEVASLLSLVDQLGGRLRPRHPGVADPSLARWFVLDGPDDRGAGESAASALRDHPAVEAAYVKPADEPPT